MIDVITSDADGILTDLYLYQHWMVYDYHTKRGLEVPKIKNPFAYDITEIYEIPKKKRDIMWIEYYPHYCKYCEARKESFETLKFWQGRGTKIAIATARAFATNVLLGPLARKWYEDWQSTYDFVPDEIIWCPEKNSGPAKAKACLDLRSELMIEDKTDNFEYILNVCDIIGINTPYNQNYQPIDKLYNLYMVNEWPQIRQKVEEIENTPRRFK